MEEEQRQLYELPTGWVSRFGSQGRAGVIDEHQTSYIQRNLLVPATPGWDYDYEYLDVIHVGGFPAHELGQAALLQGRLQKLADLPPGGCHLGPGLALGHG